MHFLQSLLKFEIFIIKIQKYVIFLYQVTNDALLKLSKTTSPQNLFPSDYITLYMYTMFYFNSICYDHISFWKKYLNLPKRPPPLTAATPTCRHLTGYAGYRDYVGTPQPPQKTPHRSTHPTEKQTPTLSPRVPCELLVVQNSSQPAQNSCERVGVFCGNSGVPT